MIDLDNTPEATGEVSQLSENEFVNLINNGSANNEISNIIGEGEVDDSFINKEQQDKIEQLEKVVEDQTQ